VTDVSKNISVGDMKIAQLAIKSKKSLIVVANKWDLINDKNLKTYDKYVQYYNNIMPFLWWAKIIPVSAIDKTRVLRILDEAIKLYEKSKIQIDKSALEKFRQKIIKIHPPTIGKGRKKPKIYEITKSEHKLSFEIVIGYKTSLNESYVRFISKKLREEFDLYGLSISIYVKKLKKMLKK
jgi:GTP-binding protein